MNRKNMPIMRALVAVGAVASFGLWAAFVTVGGRRGESLSIAGWYFQSTLFPAGVAWGFMNAHFSLDPQDRSSTGISALTIVLGFLSQLYLLARVWQAPPDVFIAASVLEYGGLSSGYATGMTLRGLASLLSAMKRRISSDRRGR